MVSFYLRRRDSVAKRFEFQKSESWKHLQKADIKQQDLWILQRGSNKPFEETDLEGTLPWLTDQASSRLFREMHLVGQGQRGIIRGMPKHAKVSEKY